MISGCILNKIFVGFQRKGTDNLIKRDSPFSDIEMYMYIRMEDNHVIGKVKKEQTVDPQWIDVMWKAAIENTKAEARATDLASMLGLPVFDAPPLIVVTNSNGYLGAAAILAAGDILPKGKYYMFPSSIHEMLVLPFTDDTNINEMTALVGQVNASTVDEDEQLGNRAYILEVR